MATKKKLKREIKALKKENKLMWRDYKDLGKDYGDYVMLYHDLIKLLAEFDSELLLKVVKSVVRDCDSAELSTRLEASEPGDIVYVNSKPHIYARMWHNGEEVDLMEVVQGDK